MATITGTDDLSIEIMAVLKNGIKIKDVPDSFDVTLDQVKRLSRLSNYLEKAEPHLSNVGLLKLKGLGLKSLYLSPLFKEDDWEGLEEVLSAIDDTTRREDFKLLLESLKKKRNRIENFQKQARHEIKMLEIQENQNIEKEQELEKIKREVDETLSKFQEYDDISKDFLLEHVGILDGQYILIKRLDSLWQAKLRKENIIEYDSEKYVHKILSVSWLVQEYHKRVKNRGGVLWDKEKERKRHNNKDTDYRFPDSPYYKNGDNAVSVGKKIAQVKQELKDNKKETERIKKKIKELKKMHVNSFMESVTFANILSPRELEIHGKLQHRATEWLYDRGCVATTEIVLPNGRRADVIGFNEKGEIYIIEVKASRSDFKQDIKWREYLPFCNHFYFLLDYAVVLHVEELDGEVNILRGDYDRTKRLKLIQEGNLVGSVQNKEEIKFSISRALSKKVIHGF